MSLIVDLRSDTVTKPTQGMLDAMMSAKIGDDVFGEDETVAALEHRLASIFHMERGLFCPSGTMANQIAIKCFTQPMDEVICDQSAHVYRYEGGGIAFHSGASVRLLQGDRGILTTDLIEPEINEPNIHYPNTSLVVLENTVNKGGGACYHLSQIEPIHTLCNIKGLKLHLDGARIFNALIATGDQAKLYGRYFDGISVCLSKGLGAPIGSVLLGSSDMIARATKIRKVLGGGMRQAGLLAAAGIYALDHHVQRLATDHVHARALAEALEPLEWVEYIMPVETNIIIFNVARNYRTDAVLQELRQEGIRCGTIGPRTIRMVTHLDVSPEMVDYAIEKIRQLQMPGQ